MDEREGFGRGLLSHPKLKNVRKDDLGVKQEAPPIYTTFSQLNATQLNLLYFTQLNATQLSSTQPIQVAVFYSVQLNLLYLLNSTQLNSNQLNLLYFTQRNSNELSGLYFTQLSS